MKNNVQELKDLLLEFGTFLQHYSKGDWGDALVRYSGLIEDIELKEAKRVIRHWFSGVGSLSDIVLEKDWVPLYKENEQLENYLNKLYSLVELGS